MIVNPGYIKRANFEVDDLPWDHHMEELIRRCWQCFTDRFPDLLGYDRDAFDVRFLHCLLVSI